MIWGVENLQLPAHNLEITDAPLDTPAPALVNPNLLLRDFLQERWKGVTPILWGLQLKQERLDELIYLSLLNADHLPDEGLKSPLTAFYLGVSEESSTDEAPHV